MMIPNKFSAMLEVIVVPPLHTIWGVLELSNKWQFPGLAFIWFIIKPVKKHRRGNV